MDEQLNEACYAIPALRKFPINTKEAAEASFGAYDVQRDSFDKAMRDVADANFSKAAAFYGIKLEHEEPEVEERPSLMFKGASEHVEMTEITSLDELEAAVDYVLDKRASTPREALAEPAKYILWAAANSEAPVDMKTDKFRKIAHIAGVGVGDREAIQHEFERRATLGPMSDAGREAFWKYAKELKGLSDDEFFSEENLNAVCDAIDGIDFMQGNQHKRAEVGYPEDVVFADTIDDLLKEASDLYYIPSIDTTMSKRATFERQKAINDFLMPAFGLTEPLEGENLIEKVASLDEMLADALLEAVENSEKG